MQLQFSNRLKLLMAFKNRDLNHHLEISKGKNNSCYLSLRQISYIDRVPYFLKWQPWHFSVMSFWLFWKIYQGFLKCLLWFMLVFLSMNVVCAGTSARMTGMYLVSSPPFFSAQCTYLVQ